MEKIRFEHVACDLCGEEKYKLRYKKPDNWLWVNQFEFPLVECLKCGLLYINPRPTKDSMSAYYPSGYHEGRDSQDHIKRYSMQSGFLPRLTDEKVLDIGCARGDFLHFLKGLYPNISACGIDLYSNKINYEGIDFVNKELMDCSFKDETFDLITAWSVLEHLHSPAVYFAQVSRVLKRGGKFIFLVPNSESLQRRKPYVEDIPRHLYHFSERSLSGYALQQGLKVSRITYDNRLCDAKRAEGPWYYYLQGLFGVTWEKRYFQKIDAVQEFAGHIGSSIDKIVSQGYWESQKMKSGVMIVEFIK